MPSEDAFMTFFLRAGLNVPDLIERQVEIGHIQAEAIVGQVVEEQLASGLWTAADLLAPRCADAPSPSDPLADAATL